MAVHLILGCGVFGGVLFCAVLFSHEMSWMRSGTELSQFLRIFATYFCIHVFQCRLLQMFERKTVMGRSGCQRAVLPEQHLKAHTARYSSCRHQVKGPCVLSRERKHPSPRSHFNICVSRNESDKGNRKGMTEASI